MKLKQLEIALQKIEGFKKPSAELEQYMTPAPLAARFLFTAYMAGDIEGLRVADLGCGTGMLSAGAALLGADVIGVDCDLSALAFAKSNAETLGVSLELINSKIDENFICEADTVIMNPPFGAQNVHADRPFIDAALNSAEVVWGIFNKGSFDFIKSYSKGKAEITNKVSAMLNIPKQFEFHTKENLEIPVEIVRLERY
ncbi:MAG: METTL5 family protein [Methanocorpusculum sp.]|nr:METTL5 family protein [Methanocorpusculum sp.]